MKRFLLTSFCFLSLICPFFSHAYEYKLSLIGAESLVGDKSDIHWEVDGITSNGYIFGRRWEKNEYHTCFQGRIYIFNEKSGFTDIETPYFFQKCAMNNAGQLIGTKDNKLFIWSKTLGERSLDIDSAPNGPLVFNDLGQLIGDYKNTYNGKVWLYSSFIWDNGILTIVDSESEFAKQFEPLGYHVMGIRLMAINNRGELAGHISYGKYHEKQKKYVVTGNLAFFWNGEIHTLPLPLKEAHEIKKMAINNQSNVLIKTDHETYLWNLQDGLKLIPNFIGDAINDNNTIVGFIGDNGNLSDESDIPVTPAIWDNGKIIKIADLLGVEDCNNMAPSFSDAYAVEAISRITSINNKGQMVCKGLIWGNWYPCVLEPVKKH